MIPGGVNSPVRAFGAVGGTPRFAVRGEGAYLVDADGTALRRPRAVVGCAAVRARAPRDRRRGSRRRPRAAPRSAPRPRARSSSPSASSPRCPRVEMVRLVSSGTEAAMSAIRLARGCTGRDLVIKFEGCYHGHSDALLAKGAGSGVATLGIPGSPGVTEGAARDTLTVPFNDLDAVDRVFAEHGDGSPRRSSSPSPRTWASCRPSPGSSRASATVCDESGRAAGVRRGDHRVPDRVRRRAGRATGSRRT